MPQEVELKLEVSRKAIRVSANLSWLRGLACGPIKRKKLTSAYFDTRTLKLRGHGLSLRARHNGEKSPANHQGRTDQQQHSQSEARERHAPRAAFQAGAAPEASPRVRDSRRAPDVAGPVRWKQDRDCV